MTTQPEDWLETLAGMEDAADLSAFLSRDGTSLPPNAPASLHAGVLAALYGDRPRALRLNQAVQKVAEWRVFCDNEPMRRLVAKSG